MQYLGGSLNLILPCNVGRDVCLMVHMLGRDVCVYTHCKEELNLMNQCDRQNKETIQTAT
jgi:hypothetical protein